MNPDDAQFSRRPAGCCSPEATPIGTDLERSVDGVIEANRVLQRHLAAYDEIARVSLEKYRQGQQIREVVRSLPSAGASIGSEVEVIGVFDARRTLRRALTATMLADGMSVEEIAVTFKVSVEFVRGCAVETARPHE